MTSSSRSTVYHISAKTEILRKDVPVEMQKLLDLYNDPKVAPEQKAIVKRELDEMIRKLEDRVETSRRLRDQHQE